MTVYWSRARWSLRLRILATVLAAVGQVAFGGSALTLARDEASAVAHVESNGINLHHGHNEATCAACTALSLHATLGRAAPRLPTAQLASVAYARRLAFRASSPSFLSNTCRAPPREA